ncbi:hypothetical protein QBC32DRAFT_207917, partial [Pseudoneurospora amorphoporcata]
GLSQIHHSTAPRLCLTQFRDLRTGSLGLGSSCSTDNPTGPPSATLLFFKVDDGMALRIDE